MGREKEIKIRLTHAEHSLLMAKRGKMRLATWMRESCLSGMPAAIPLINVRALSELHRIGSNLNQLARSVNSDISIDLQSLHDQASALRLALLGAVKDEQ